MDKTKYRIAYFHQDGLITGSAISLRHFLNALDREVFEPIVILANEGPARQLYEGINIEVKVYPFSTFWTFPGPNTISRGMLRQLQACIPNRSLKRFITNEVKPDLIHINDKAAMNVGITMKAAGIPIIQHSRSSYKITTSKVGAKLNSKLIKRYASHIIAISEDEEDLFEDFKNLSIIYNTVDFELTESARKLRLITRKEFNYDDRDVVIGFAAAVNEKKGAWDFLEICNSLKYDNKFKFLLVGKLETVGKTYLSSNNIVPIPPADYIKNYIHLNNLGDKLTVTGFRNDNLNLIAAMDVLIVPNKNGVLGRQPIEAQALGVNVIAYKGHSGKSKIILDKITGTLVNNKKEVIDILESLDIKLLKSQKESITSHAKKMFTPSVNMSKIEQLYKELLR